MTNKDRVREQLEEFALHLKPGTTKGKHRTAIFDTLELTSLVQHLITAEIIAELERLQFAVTKTDEMLGGFKGTASLKTIQAYIDLRKVELKAKETQ